MEEVRGEDYLYIRSGSICFRVVVEPSHGFCYMSWDYEDADAENQNEHIFTKRLTITPLPGREAICRRFAAMTHLRYSGATVVIVGGEDAEQ